MKTAKKIFAVVVGIILMHFAVAVTMVADIGLGGYDAFAYSITHITNISIGTIFIIMAGVFMLCQIVWEGKEFKKREYFQLLFIFGSGFAIDIVLKMGVENWVFDGMFAKILAFCTAVCLKSFSIMLIIESLLMKMPLEGLCQIASERTKFTIGKLRMFCDVFFLAGVVAMTLLFEIQLTIGLGTILTMLIQGPMMDVFKNPIDKMYSKLGVC